MQAIIVPGRDIKNPDEFHELIEFDAGSRCA
jgi:hypothetical protein